MKHKQNKIRNFIKKLLVFAAIVSCIMAPAAVSFATSFDSNLQTINKEAKLPDFGTNGHSLASYETGASNITSAIYYVVDLIKYLLGGIAVVMIIISGIRLITSVKNVDDVAEKQKENLKYAIIGLIVVITADVVVQKVFFGQYGEFWRTKTDAQMAAEAGTEQIKGIYNFVEMGMAALAILMIVYAGIKLVVYGSKEEELGSAKKQITWAVVGLMLAALSEFAVKDVIFPGNGKSLPNVMAAQLLIVNITNFVSGFIATVAIAMYMYGGYLYVIDTGKDENSGKAKKVLSAATIGLFLAMGAFGIVNTVIKVEPLAVTGTQEVQGP